MKIRATLVELWKRKIKATPNQNNIYLNGENNLYPSEIERVINNSPTAFRCAKLMSNYIAGDLVGEDYIVNRKRGDKLSKIVALAARSIAYQNGVFFHIEYGFDTETAELKPVSLDVLDYCKCRLSKEDTEENPGKIYYNDYENTLNFNKKDEQWFYPYNPNTEVVLAQIKADCTDKNAEITEAIKHYRGQVYYLNLTPEYVYALPFVDSVFNDADSEFRFSLYVNAQFRNGFLGKVLFRITGLDQEDNQKIKTDISEFLGAENSGNAYVLNVEKAENLDNAMKIDQLKPQFDDKLIEKTREAIKSNILGAFNNIPEPLVLAGNGALFGTNSETYIQMKQFYTEQTKYEREQLRNAFQYLGFQLRNALAFTNSDKK